MKERWKKIRTSLLITVFAVLGVVEYVQLMTAFDVPQALLVLPIVGALTTITLRKRGFIALAGMTVLSCVYQIVAGGQNAIHYLQTNVSGVVRILLYVLPVCLIFELIGMGGGALIRIFINRKKNIAVGVACIFAGVLVTVGPYLWLFQNPLYPIQARVRLQEYVEKTYTDYAISAKTVYFDLNTSDYRCRATMSDGRIRVAYFDENGEPRSEK